MPVREREKCNPAMLPQLPTPVPLCRSVVQFQYGEDGIDVMQVGFLRKFGFLSQNVARFAQQLDVGRVQQASAAAGTAELEAAAQQQTRWVTELAYLCLIVRGSRQPEA